MYVYMQDVCEVIHYTTHTVLYKNNSYPKNSSSIIVQCYDDINIETFEYAQTIAIVFNHSTTM